MYAPQQLPAFTGSRRSRGASPRGQASTQSRSNETIGTPPVVGDRFGGEGMTQPAGRHDLELDQAVDLSGGDSCPSLTSLGTPDLRHGRLRTAACGGFVKPAFWAVFGLMTISVFLFTSLPDAAADASAARSALFATLAAVSPYRGRDDGAGHRPAAIFPSSAAGEHRPPPVAGEGIRRSRGGGGRAGVR